jgi:hypothetical protein
MNALHVYINKVHIHKQDTSLLMYVYLARAHLLYNG